MTRHALAQVAFGMLAFGGCSRRDENAPAASEVVHGYNNTLIGYVHMVKNLGTSPATLEIDGVRHVIGSGAWAESSGPDPRGINADVFQVCNLGPGRAILQIETDPHVDLGEGSCVARTRR